VNWNSSSFAVELPFKTIMVQEEAQGWKKYYEKT